MKRIIVGVDQSPAAQAALGWAAGIAAGTGADLVVVHAFPERLNELPLDQRQKLEAALGNQLDEWVAPASEAGVNTEIRLCEGDPRLVMLDQAAVDGADLLVVGRTGESAGPGVLHLGSMAEYLAHHTTFPLAVVPPEHSGVRRIALGLDGSPESTGAAEWCADVAAALDAWVVGVSVVEPVAEWTPPNSPKNWRRGTEADIERWAGSLIERGVELKVIAERGLHPAVGLLQVAEAQKADMVVIGTRGVGGFSGLRVGGTALKVLHGATMPVVLVPPVS